MIYMYYRNVASLPNVFNSIGTVEMRFKSEEATTKINLEDLPDISTVYLGDKFYMYLKYIGQQGNHHDCIMTAAENK